MINIQISPTDTTQFKATTDISLKEVLQTVCKIHALEINSGIFQYTDIKDSSVTLSTTVGELKSRNLKLVVIQGICTFCKSYYCFWFIYTLFLPIFVFAPSSLFSSILFYLLLVVLALVFFSISICYRCCFCF